MPPKKTYPPFSSADIVAIGYFHEREEGETERDRDRDMHYSVHNSQSTEEGQMPGVLRAPSSENDGLRRKFSRRTHNPVSLCDQVRKKKTLYMPNYSSLAQGKIKRCYFWLEESSWMITCGLLRDCSQVCPPPQAVASTGPLQEPSPLASGPDFLIGLPFTRKHCVKGAIFKPIKWLSLLSTVKTDN